MGLVFRATVFEDRSQRPQTIRSNLRISDAKCRQVLQLLEFRNAFVCDVTVSQAQTVQVFKRSQVGKPLVCDSCFIQFQPLHVDHFSEVNKALVGDLRTSEPRTKA